MEAVAVVDLADVPAPVVRQRAVEVYGDITECLQTMRNCSFASSHAA